MPERQRLRRSVVERVAIAAIGIQAERAIGACGAAGIRNDEHAPRVDVRVVGQHVARGGKDVVFGGRGCIVHRHRRFVRSRDRDAEPARRGSDAVRGRVAEDLADELPLPEALDRSIVEAIGVAAVAVQGQRAVRPHESAGVRHAQACAAIDVRVVVEDVAESHRRRILRQEGEVLRGHWRIVGAGDRDGQGAWRARNAVRRLIREYVARGLAEPQRLRGVVVQRVGIAAGGVQGQRAVEPGMAAGIRDNQRGARVRVRVVRQHVAGSGKHSVLRNLGSVVRRHRGIVSPGDGDRQLRGSREQAVGRGVAKDVGDELSLRQRLRRGAVERVVVAAVAVQDQAAVRAHIGAGVRHAQHRAAVRVEIVGEHVAESRRHIVFEDEAEIVKSHRRVVHAGDSDVDERVARGAAGILRLVGEHVVDRLPLAQELHRTVIEIVGEAAIGAQRQHAVAAEVGARIDNGKR